MFLRALVPQISDASFAMKMANLEGQDWFPGMSIAPSELFSLLVPPNFESRRRTIYSQVSRFCDIFSH